MACARQEKSAPPRPIRRCGGSRTAIAPCSPRWPPSAWCCAARSPAAWRAAEIPRAVAMPTRRCCTVRTPSGPARSPARPPPPSSSPSTPRSANGGSQPRRSRHPSDQVPQEPPRAASRDRRRGPAPLSRAEATRSRSRRPHLHQRVPTEIRPACCRRRVPQACAAPGPARGRSSAPRARSEALLRREGASLLSPRPGQHRTPPAGAVHVHGARQRRQHLLVLARDPRAPGRHRQRRGRFYEGRRPMTAIAPHISAFLLERLPVERRASPHTQDSYSYAFQLLFQFMSERLTIPPSALHVEQIDAPLVLDFLNHLERDRGNGASTRNVRLAAIKSFFR